MEKDRLLKLFYAAALADAAYYYGKFGIIEEVTEEKKKKQSLSSKTQLEQLGIEDLGQLYHRFSETFGCASWNFNEGKNGEDSNATTTSCMLCALAKKQGSARPCDAFCINPFTSFAENLGYTLEVKSTLWDGPECCFSHTVK